jgi:hypothetical protein
MTSFRIVTVFPAVFAAVFVLPASGCSTSRTMLRPDRLPPQQAMVQARKLTEALAGTDVIVELVTSNGDPTTKGPVRTGKVTAIDEKTFLLSEAPDRAYRVPFEDTRSLSTINRKRGAADGMLVGVLLGGVAGAIFGAEASRLGCDADVYPPRCPSAAGTAVPVGVAGALLGGALGTGLGAIIGHRLSFTF